MMTDAPGWKDVAIITLLVLLLISQWQWHRMDGYMSDKMMQSATLGFEAGYQMADPSADSAEVAFHREWYRRAIHPDSTAYYLKPGARIYDSKPTDTDR